MEHAGQAPQSLTAQSTGQSFTLHTFVSVSSGQGEAPKAAWVCTVRVRFTTPGPHALEHVVPHELHSFISQLIGQRCALQILWPVCGAHALPPCCGLVKIWRQRVDSPRACPSPCQQSWLHSVQLDHAELAQSIGHNGCAGQSPSSEVTPQAAPLFSGSRPTRRERTRRPAPQVTLHEPQLPHGSRKQSTGHAPPLHDCDSSRAPHGTPPC